MPRPKKVKLPVKNLIIGLMVDIELPWSKHPFLFSKFKITDPEEIAIIRQLKLKEVTVFPEQSDIDVGALQADKPDLPSSTQTEAAFQARWDDKTTKVEGADQYRVKRMKLDKQYKDHSMMAQRVIKDMRSAPANAIEDAYTLAQNLTDEIEGYGDIFTNLVNLGSGEHTLYNHSINVMILSMTLGKSVGIKGLEMTILARGALLHDMGKINIPNAILNKQANLSRAEMGVFKQHPQHSRRLCEIIEGSREELLQILHMHHEYLDGSGYPEGISGDKIPLLPRIVTIANTYDNLCNPPNIKLAMTPKIALATMYSKLKDQLDNALVQSFIGILGVYPAGSIVSLNDESLGVVVSVDPKHMMTPEVLVYNPDIPPTKALILNLTEHPELKIVRVLKPSQCPRRVYSYLGVKDRLGYIVTGRS